MAIPTRQGRPIQSPYDLGLGFQYHYLLNQFEKSKENPKKKNRKSGDLSLYKLNPHLLGLGKANQRKKERMGVGVTAPLSHSVGLVRLQFQHTTHKKRGLARVFLGHKYHNHHHHHHNSISIISNCTTSSNTTSPTTTATTTTTTATSGCGDLEVKELKERCKKWEWKGQYSITYFVSQSSNNNKPPLLLVHGFGASIPHWRRLVFLTSFNSTSTVALKSQILLLIWVIFLCGQCSLKLLLFAIQLLIHFPIYKCPPFSHTCYHAYNNHKKNKGRLLSSIE